MIHDPMTVFNRQILNSICILVRQNGGELHGHWPLIADKVACDLGLSIEAYDEIAQKMQDHLIAVGLDHITAGSPVVFFRSMSGELHLVSKELLHEPE